MPTKLNPYKIKEDPITINFTRSVDGDLGTYTLFGGPDFSGSNSVMTGDNIPGYKERLKQSLSCTTYLGGQEFDAHFGKGQVKVNFHRILPNLSTEYAVTTWAGPLSTYAGLSQGSTGLAKIDPSVVNSRASEGFNRRALEAQRALQSLVSAGEMGETLRMIRNPLKSLYEGCYDYLGAVKKRTRRARKDRDKKQIISDTWLEYSFGWKPLVADVKGAADAMARLGTHSPPHKTVQFRDRQNAKRDPIRSTIDLYNTRLQRDIETIEQYSVKFKGSISIASTPQFTTDVLGLSMRDLVPTLWELIPYSFLVDYFTTCGSMIDYYSLRSSDFRWGWKGTELLTTVVHKLSHVSGYGSGEWIYDGISGGCGDSVVNNRLVSREQADSFPRPSLRFKLPHSSTQWLNIAALSAASDRTSRIVNGY